MDGSLITVANSTIRAVKNMSSTWSQVDARIALAPSADARAALDVMRAVGAKLREDWPQRVTESPEVLGVDELSGGGVTVRMLVRTPPLERWEVQRELLLRLHEAFRQGGVEMK